MRKAGLLFVNKKKQKNFLPLVSVFELYTEPKGMKFFGSFFQKRTAPFQ
jgi:hypothetical protein